MRQIPNQISVWDKNDYSNLNVGMSCFHLFYPERLKGLWHLRGRGHVSFHSFISFLRDNTIPFVYIPHGVVVEEYKYTFDTFPYAQVNNTWTVASILLSIKFFWEMTDNVIIRDNREIKIRHVNTRTDTVKDACGIFLIYTTRITAACCEKSRPFVSLYFQ